MSRPALCTTILYSFLRTCFILILTHLKHALHSHPQILPVQIDVNVSVAVFQEPDLVPNLQPRQGVSVVLPDRVAVVEHRGAADDPGVGRQPRGDWWDGCKLEWVNCGNAYFQLSTPFVLTAKNFNLQMKK